MNKAEWKKRRNENAKRHYHFRACIGKFTQEERDKILKGLGVKL